MGGIFISYRREDSRHASGRLYQHLVGKFSNGNVFMDVDSIEPGLDFVKVLTKTVAHCEALIVVIGPGWLNARDEAGARRLEDPDDFVRLEIEAALARDIRVIPVLVDGAIVPKAADLPESLKSLVRRNAIRLSHERFGADAQSLAESLARAIEPAPVEANAAAASRNPSKRDAYPATAIVAPHQTSDDSEVRRGTRRAIAFATLVLPIAFGSAVLIGELKITLFFPGRPDGAGLTGWLIGAVLCIALGIFLIRSRPSPLAAAETAIYWLGFSALAIVTSFLWAAISRVMEAPLAVLIAAVLVVVTAATLALQHRSKSSRASIGLYCFGSTLAVISTMYVMGIR